MMLVFLSLFVLAPALIFSNLENNWDFVDAIYFVFISLTTIGLGDYIPGDDDGQIYKDVYKFCVAGQSDRQDSRTDMGHAILFF